VNQNDHLIERATAALNPRRVGDRLFGDVACALVTDAGSWYVGVCIDTASGTGFCAEHAAIAAMVTAGGYRIDRIVAVWRDDSGVLFSLPPCGRVISRRTGSVAVPGLPGRCSGRQPGARPAPESGWP
jgi:cytidine deaminase